MTKYNPKTTSLILLEAFDYGRDGELSLDKIATEFYGRTYVAQQTGDMMPNDSYHRFTMDTDTVDELNGDMERARKDKGHYLGLKRVAKGKGMFGGDREAVYVPGINWFDYWLALKWDNSVPFGDTPEDWEDARGFVYRKDFEVYRQAPTPNYVLADLIKNDILPYGDYLLNVCW